ncbi:hypothetical protein ACIO6T_30750 [Streptomyces sp. NPDC087532]|uniref:hypothetical protein n=1 Tax=Streptomyces sp. NPDC087532 TaxID=3365795 RepID=UPI003826E7EB
MDAYDVAQHIAQARGWKYRPQSMGPDQARLMVEDERRWAGVTRVTGGVVLLAAGAILPGGEPTSPLVETSAMGSDLDGLAGAVDVLWRRLDEA